MKTSHIYIIILLVLVSLFTLYNIDIYKSDENYAHVQFSQQAIDGEQIWLQNNCNGCHQLYGLGGYLGPDLTNVFSAKGKGEHYIKAMLNSGINAMPKFNFTELEKDRLVQFLKEVDETGIYPNIESTIQPNGWVEIKKKLVDATE